ncbi:hypothetical protein AB0M48_43450 [Lentzea sp. NPDC051208]|uniref:hypothetical protein n=1 Tax=Lentzea sp. NPDC051208 TaxID=3154642 RepID=UPI003441AD9D
MELKQAMEAATAELDVRPGFVGDVMAGGRRRHTRKLVAVTAVVALLAGVTTGVVLTRSPEPPADPRLTAATTGPLAGDSELIETALHLWNDAQKQPWKLHEPVTEVSKRANVFWTGQTPSGPVALVAQEVRVRDSEKPAALVGLVADGAVAGREVVQAESRDHEVGLYRFGPLGDHYVVLTLGKTVSWSMKPVRGPDNRLTRVWASAPHDEDGVVFTVAPLSDRPVFVRGDSVPKPDDFTQPPVLSRYDYHPDRAFVPHPGLGWSGQNCATAAPEERRAWPDMKREHPQRELQKRALLDYLVGWDATGDWSVCAWLPDGRYALMFEAYGDLYGALYQPDGTFSAPVLGGRAVKGEPAVLALPDGQGTIVADFNATIGPEERDHAWLAPAGTKEVTVVQRGVPKVVQLP